jgi:hypothetical protein
MTHSRAHTMNSEDRLIVRILFGFLSTPLLLLMGAATMIAL